MKIIYPILLILTTLLSMTAHAERSTRFGEYIVHYNAFRSDIIPPEVALRHSIVRSDHRGLVNITVLKKQADGSTQPVAARVQGTSRNLAEQMSELEFFPVQEQETIYSLDQFRINDHDTLRFEIQVEPEGDANNTRGTVKFIQNFYTD